MRRLGTGGRLSRRSVKLGSSGVASLGVPDTIPDLFAWYRGDYGITLNGSNVSAWADQATASVQDATQGTAANQPPYVVTDANYNGNSYVGPLDGTADYLTAGAAADWEFLHTGAGMTVAIVFRTGALGAIRRLFDNINGTSTALGITCLYTSASPAALSVVIGNGAAAVVSASTAASITADTTYRLIFRHATANTPDWDLSLNGVTTTGNNLAAPGAGAAAATINIGRRTGGVQYFNGSFAEIAVYNRAISDAEKTTLNDYLVTRYF